jgi:hypothetical protein
MPTEFYSSTVVARKLGCDYRQIKRAVELGLLTPSATIDGKPAYDWNAVVEMLGKIQG